MTTETPGTEQVRRASPERLLKIRTLRERSDWLPSGLWPELDELRAEHGEWLEAVREAGNEQIRLREQFKDEDEALNRAVAAGTEPPEVTPGAERDATLKMAVAKSKAERDRLGEFLARALETIADKEPEWRNDLARLDIEAEAKREEARRLLADADRKAGEVLRTRRWVQRTAKEARTIAPNPQNFLPHDAMPVPPPLRKASDNGIGVMSIEHA